MSREVNDNMHDSNQQEKVLVIQNFQPQNHSFNLKKRNKKKSDSLRE